MLEVLDGEAAVALRLRDGAIESKRRGRRVGEERRSDPSEGRHLRDELAHVVGAGAGGGLVRHAREPLDVAGLEETGEGHEHQAHGAVRASERPDAAREPVVDHVCG